MMDDGNRYLRAEMYIYIYIFGGGQDEWTVVFFWDRGCIWLASPFTKKNI